MGVALLVAMAAGVGLLRSSAEPAIRSAPPTSTTATGPTLAPSPTTAVISATTVAWPCRASDLRVTGGASQGAGGTRYTGLGFTNRSSSPCTLAGHPTVTFLDRAGRVLGRAAPTPVPETVTVSPGQYATTALGVASTSVGTCQAITPATLRIVLPSGGALSVAAGDFVFCLGQNPGVRHFSGPFTD